MATPTDAPAQVVRIPMSWPEFLAWAPDPENDWKKVEYYDGELVVSFPDRQHQLAMLRLVNLLSPELPDSHEVLPDWGWREDDAHRQFQPDVLVYPKPEGNVARLPQAPLLAVEITSSNRRDDLVTKLRHYAAAGVQHYWVLDRGTNSLLVYDLAGGDYLLVQVITAGADAQIDFGVGRAVIDLDRLLAL
jgi:Uma2 family endonuclease